MHLSATDPFQTASEHARCLDASLILYAEHEFNASTFTARVCAATLSDFYSCITGRISLLLARCSLICADQPVTRASTKMGVKSGVGTPMKW